ncbi:hypothetical protein TNCV_2447591 [Trichonephila clavipes]|uniref:Uncharacterized protein n=1 Tax=Trichonephila clavipes TaxID=2585209 RepID=A0A8X6SJG5_TRICX|nr:hypothetical protein TNCV_2447591 [Trichonephila clavipes]
MVNVRWRDPRFTNGIGVLKKTGNPPKTMEALNDLRPSKRNAENLALVSECVRRVRLQTLSQIAEARRLRFCESICYKPPQFWQ